MRILFFEGNPILTCLCLLSSAEETYVPYLWWGTYLVQYGSFIIPFFPFLLPCPQCYTFPFSIVWWSTLRQFSNVLGKSKTIPCTQLLLVTRLNDKQLISKGLWHDFTFNLCSPDLAESYPGLVLFCPDADPESVFSRIQRFDLWTHSLDDTLCYIFRKLSLINSFPISVNVHCFYGCSTNCNLASVATA